MRSSLVAAVVLVAMLAAACGTVTVETTAATDIGKVDVERAADTSDPEADSVPTVATAPPPSTSWAPNLPEGVGETAAAADAAASSTTTTGPTTTTSPATPTTTTTATTTTTTTTTTTIPLEYHDVGYVQFAWAGDLAVHLPVSRYETVGFHESGHDGAFQLDVVGLADWTTLESRGRGTGSRTAADIVVPPDELVVAPISGTVIRAGTYTLYCDHSDNFVVVEPDGRPGWELKIFHFEGLSVGVGDTVVAGETTIGSNARVLPFESQVDEFTATPSNPHVHIEVIDTSIPDRPSSGGGC